MGKSFGAGAVVAALLGVVFAVVPPDRWRPVEDAARACRITGPGAHPRCRVGVASVGGNTQLNVTLSVFGS